MLIFGSLLLPLALAGPLTTTTPHGISTTTRPALTTTRQASTTTRPNSPAGSGTTTTTSPIEGGTLLPVVHWDFPVDDIRNLKPGNATQLYYSSERVTDPDVEHLFAAIDATLTHETVILDHSKYVKDVSCGADGILVSFIDSAAFAYAAREWGAVGDFLLVTYTDGCGTSTDDRTYWLVDSIDPNSATNSITAHTKNGIATEDAITGVHLFWGKYEPPSQSTTGGGSQTTGVTSVANGGSTTTTSRFTTTPRTTTSDGSMVTTTAVADPSCGAAPSSTIDGLPAAACGNELFDKLLDDALGYVDFSNGVDQATWNAIAPGLAYPGSKSRRSLRARGFWDDPLGSIGNAISDGANFVYDKGSQAVGVVGDGVKAGVQWAGDKVDDLRTWEKKFDPVDVPIDLGPSDDKKEDTPSWGQQFVIWQKEKTSANGKAELNLYCIDCGVKGTITLAGELKYALPNLSPDILVADMLADLTAAFHLGLVGSVDYSKTFKREIVSVPIPGLAIAVTGIFSVGAFFDVNAKAVVSFKGEGEARAGVTAKWPNFHVRVDMVNPISGSVIEGLKPDFEPIYNAKGSVTAGTELSLPVAMNLGLKIPALSFDKVLAVIEEPGISGSATLAGSIGKGAGQASETCNNGIAFEVNAFNRLSVDVFGITSWKPFDDTWPIIDKCYQLPGQNTGGDGGDGEGSGGEGDSGEGSGGQGSSGEGSGGEGSDGQGSGESGSEGGGEGSESGGQTNGAGDGNKVRRRRRSFYRRQDDEGDADFDYDKDPDNAEFLENAKKALAQAEKIMKQDSGTLTTIVESFGGFAIYPDDDGNFYATDPVIAGDSYIDFFQVDHGKSANDDEERIFFYYPQEMAKYGASRIRVADTENFPKTAQIVMFEPYNIDGKSDTDNPLIVVTSEGDGFAPVMCDFEDKSGSKMFIVEDQKGLDNLVDPKLRYTVTGKIVDSCEPVQLVLK